MDLETIVTALAKLAPLGLAESWDNVGLLVEPARARAVERALLAVDLTPAVVAEAAQTAAALIVAYHPILFHGLKRLTRATSEGALLLSLVQHELAVYSPHTALDAVEGGLNDWLCEAFGPGERRSLRPASRQSADEQYKLVTFLPREHVSALRQALSQAGVAGVIDAYGECSFEVLGHGTFRGSPETHPSVGEPGRFERVDEVRLEMVCRGDRLQQLSALLRLHHPYETPAWDLVRLEPKPEKTTGQGREIVLANPLSLEMAVERLKDYLGLLRLRVSEVSGSDSIQRIAVCAGSGTGVLQDAPADLYVTGEMRHHDVLAARARGTNVILIEHFQSESRYLPKLACQLAELIPGVDWRVAESSRPPIEIV